MSGGSAQYHHRPAPVASSQTASASSWYAAGYPANAESAAAGSLPPSRALLFDDMTRGYGGGVDAGFAGHDGTAVNNNSRTLSGGSLPTSNPTSSAAYGAPDFMAARLATAQRYYQQQVQTLVDRDEARSGPDYPQGMAGKSAVHGRHPSFPYVGNGTILSPTSYTSTSPTLSAVSASPSLLPTRNATLPSPGLGPAYVPAHQSPPFGPGPSPSFGPLRSGSAASGATLYSMSAERAPMPLSSPSLPYTTFQQQQQPQQQQPQGNQMLGTASKQSCKFYNQGNCKYGDACRFQHPISSNQQQHVGYPGPGLARTASGSAVLPAGMTMNRPPMAPLQGVKVSSPPLPAEMEPAQLPQLHGGALGPAGQKVALINGTKGLQQIYFGRKIQKTCRFWMRGTCRFGDTCRYMHEYSQPHSHHNNNNNINNNINNNGNSPFSLDGFPRLTPRALLAAYANARDRPDNSSGTRAFVQSLDEREKAELRMLLGMEGPRTDLDSLEARYLAMQREEQLRMDADRQRSPFVPERGAYGEQEYPTREEYEEILRAASPQTRAQLLGMFEDEQDGDAIYTYSPVMQPEKEAELGSVRVVGVGEELDDGLALPAARLAGLSLSSDTGSDSAPSPMPFLDRDLSSGSGSLREGLQEHPLLVPRNTAVQMSAYRGDSLDHGPFADVFPTTTSSSSGQTTPMQASDFNPSPPSGLGSGSSHEKISSPEVRAIFGADVPPGAVSFAAFGGPRVGASAPSGSWGRHVGDFDPRFGMAAWLDDDKW